MTEHVLKTLPVYWDAIERGDKNFEVRRDDRGFQRGDVLVLRKIDGNGWFSTKPGTGCHDYTKSRWIDAEYYDLRRRITYILTGGQFGIEPGYVVMALGEEAELW